MQNTIDIVSPQNPPHDASQFMATLENMQGLKVACLGEIAFRQKGVEAAQLEKRAQAATKNGDCRHLPGLQKEPVFR